MSRTIKIVLIIIIIVLIGTGLAFWKFWPKKNNSNPATTASKTGLFGTMLAFNANDAMTGKTDALQKGWSQFRQDNSAYQNFKSNLEKIIQDHTKLVKITGFAIDREIVPYFTWNVVEPQKGQFDWELTDMYVKGATNANVKVSAVIQPFASWDQENTSPLANCRALDFAYYDYKVGPPNDLAEYENFLTKTVERYKDNVAIWEIGNEYDGQCGGYKDNPQGYFGLVQISSETIKKADPQAKIANGGALELTHQEEAESIKAFWTKFFELGGGQYLDYFNLHYNSERSGGAQSDPSTYIEHFTFFNDLMEKFAQGGGGQKPIIVTEIGTYSGTPSSQVGPPGGGQQPGPDGQPAPAGQQVQGQTSLPTQSEDFQAAWYFKYSILAFANGANVVFIDLVGNDNDVIGGSAMFNLQGSSREILVILKTINQKLTGFSKAEKIADGQYKFTVNNKTIYALWSGTLPNEISGKIKVTDIKGQEQTMDAAGIKLSADQPVLVEL